MMITETDVVAGTADRETAQAFITARHREGLFAAWRGTTGNFTALVIPETECLQLLLIEKPILQELAEKHGTTLCRLYSLGDSFSSHPNHSPGSSRMAALEASHQAYLGTLALQPSAQEL